MTTMKFEPVRPEHAARLINHGPTVLVTSAHGGKRNVMAAAWSMQVNFDPPQLALVIDAATFTRGLVEASGAFGICVPGRTLIDVTYAVGSVSGRDIDKFTHWQIEARSGPVLGMPVIET